MKKLIVSLGLLVSIQAFAAGVAVVDTQRAIMQTTEAQKVLASVRADVTREETALAAISKQIDALEKEFMAKQKDLSPDQIKSYQQRAQAKVKEFNERSLKLENRVNAAQNQLIEKYFKRMQEVMNRLRSSGGYDVILERSSTLSFNPALDLTEEVTRQLNQGS